MIDDDADEVIDGPNNKYDRWCDYYTNKVPDVACCLPVLVTLSTHYLMMISSGDGGSDDGDDGVVNLEGGRERIDHKDYHQSQDHSCPTVDLHDDDDGGRREVMIIVVSVTPSPPKIYRIWESCQRLRMGGP